MFAADLSVLYIRGPSSCSLGRAHPHVQDHCYTQIWVELKVATRLELL